jgi:hypothetical protein
LYPSKTWDYATWRFDRYKAHIGTLEDDPLDLTWPFVIVMDVLEHLPDPAPVLAKLAKCTEWIMCNPWQVRYTAIWPQHISRYDPRPAFDHVEGFLWHRT